MCPERAQSTPACGDSYAILTRAGADALGGDEGGLLSRSPYVDLILIGRGPGFFCIKTNGMAPV